MNKNNQNEYKPNIYGSANQQSQGYMPNTNKSNGQQRKSKKLSGCFSIILLLWFVGSIILMVFLSSKKLNGFCVATLGQAFFIFGTVVLLKSNNSGFFKALPSLFILAGASVIILGITLQQGLTKELMQSILQIATFVILGVGLLIILATVIMDKYKSRLYTYKVDAVVSELKVTQQRGDRGRILNLYAPVYQYEYNGLTYTHSSNDYSNFGVKPVGTHLKIYINPLEPQKIHIKNKTDIIIGIIVGLLVIAIGIFVPLIIK